MTIPHILVVDDEADIRGLLKEILSEEGYEVEVAADAGQARSARAAQVPDSTPPGSYRSAGRHDRWVQSGTGTDRGSPPGRAFG